MHSPNTTAKSAGDADLPTGNVVSTRESKPAGRRGTMRMVAMETRGDQRTGHMKGVGFPQLELRAEAEIREDKLCGVAALQSGLNRLDPPCAD
ncbi:unnamed protein product [Lota lota]